MTAKTGKYSLFAVVIIALMVSAAFIPAVDALSNVNDESDAIAIEENTTETTPVEYDSIRAITEALGLDADSGLAGILELLGLSGMDLETLKSLFKPSSSAGTGSIGSILDAAKAAIGFDMTALESLLVCNGNSTEKYHIDYLEIYGIAIVDADIIVEFDDEGTIISIAVIADTIESADDDTEVGFKNVKIFLAENVVKIEIASYFTGGSEPVKIDFILNINASQAAPEFSVSIFGYAVGISISGTVATVFMTIPKISTTIGELVEVTLEGIYFGLNSKTELDIHVDKAYNESGDLTDTVNQILKGLCGSHFKVEKSIPQGQIPGYEIEGGEVEIDYQIHEKFSCSIHAESVSPKSEGITITNPQIKISTTELNVSFDSITGTFDGATVDVGKYIKSLEIVQSVTDYRFEYRESLDYLNIYSGESASVTGIFCGFKDAQRDEKALDIEIDQMPSVGTRIECNTGHVELKILGQQIFYLFRSLTNATYQDNGQSLVAYTINPDTKKCDMYLSMDYVKPADTKYIYTKFVKNNDVIDEVIAMDFIYPPIGDCETTIKAGIGFGDPRNAFATLMFTHDDDGDEGYTIDTAYKGSNGTVYNADAYISDDELELNAFGSNYTIGYTNLREIGARFAMSEDRASLSFFMQGVKISHEGQKDLTIESATLIMSMSLGGDTIYRLIINGGYLGETPIADGVEFSATVSQTSGIKDIELTADILNFDLGDGIKIGSTKTLKGTGTNGTDGPVLDVYLDGMKENAHVYLDSNKMDVFFNGTVGSLAKNQKMGLLIDKNAGTVTRTLDAKGYGGVFKVENIRFNETSKTLSIGSVSILDGRQVFTNMAGTFASDKFTFAVDNISGSKTTGTITGSLVMGSDTVKAFTLEVTKDTAEKITRTIKADLQSVEVRKDDNHYFRTTTGNYTESVVDGEAVRTQAELNGFDIHMTGSPHLTMGKITMDLDNSKMEYSLVVENMDGKIHNLNIKAGKITTKATIDVQDPKVTVSIVSDNVRIPFKNGSENAELQISKITDSAVISTYVESASTAIDTASYSDSASADEIDIKNVRLTYDGENDDMDFTYDKILVKLTDASIDPLITGVKADINLAKDQKQKTIDLQIGQISAWNVFDLNAFSYKYATDGEGKITPLQIRIGTITSTIGVSMFHSTVTVSGFGIDGNDAGNKYTLGVTEISGTETLSIDTIVIIRSGFKFTNISAVAEMSADGSITITMDGKFEFNDGEDQPTTLATVEIDDLMTKFTLADTTTMEISVKKALLEMPREDNTYMIDLSGSSANGNIVYGDDSAKASFTVNEKAKFGIKDKLTFAIETTDSFSATLDYAFVDYPTEMEFKSSLDKFSVTIGTSTVSAEALDVKTEIALKNLTTQPRMDAESHVNLTLEYKGASDSYFLKIKNANASASYTFAGGLVSDFTLERFDYGGDKCNMTIVGGEGDLEDGIIFDEIYFKDTDNKIDLTFNDSLFLGPMTFASSVTGTVGDVDVGTIQYSGKALGDYYCGTYYFSISEGIRAFKNGETITIPDDAFHIHLMPVTVRFADISQDYEIPIGTVLKFNGYYDIIGSDVAVTQNSYQLLFPYDVLTVVPCKTIDNIVDDKGVAKVEGSGIVFNTQALDKLTVKEITIENGNDMVIKISVDALKRLSTGTEMSMLGFDKTAATEENLSGVLVNLTEEQKAKALAGTVVMIDVGTSTVTDSLGNVEITVPFHLGDQDQNKLKAYYINGDKLELVSSVTYSDGKATFTTTHFSEFLICEEISKVPSEKGSNLVIALIATAVIIAFVLLVTWMLFRDNRKETA